MGLLDFFKKGTEKPAQPDVASQYNQPQNQQEDTYTVKSGDSLSKIAKNYYGDAMQWKKIYEANKEQIGANLILFIPARHLKSLGHKHFPLTLYM